MRNEAIVLAGGLGTRLRSAVADLPKSMAPVAEKPFLEYTLDMLRKTGVTHVVLAVGYKHEAIVSHFGDTYQGMQLSYSVEHEPLGTGGATAQALNHCESEVVWVLNGDTLFHADFEALRHTHEANSADLTLALKPMRDSNRYGRVRMDEDGKVLRFEERQAFDFGLINAGVYRLRKAALLDRISLKKFSFETDFMEKKASDFRGLGSIQDRYFLDIGIPEDYERAQWEFPNLERAQALKIDSDWTLFLDRDGVINVRIIGDYVKSPEEFEFTPLAPEAIALLTQKFGRTVVVTNQQCIGKGVITWEDLHAIHSQMKTAIESAGGQIDAIYAAPQLAEENNPMRKPGTGMGLQAQRDFPQIDFSRSVMIGDSPTDIEFGKALGMTTVFIGDFANHGETEADFCFDSLATAAQFLC